MSDMLDQLVEFVAHTRYEDLPQAVVARARLVLMDTIGAILAGSPSPEVRNLAHHASEVSHAQVATVLGYQSRADPSWASLVNATAGTSTELDEGHAYARGHPAIHVIPAALALGEQGNHSVSTVLTSIVLGYEVAARVGTACELRAAAHPHGTWGTLGAAAAAAKILGYDHQEIRETINLASSLTLATSFQTAIQGALVRNVYAGVANQMGLLAAQLTRCGFTGERNGPVTIFGLVMSDTFREEALTDRLGERYEITRGYFKIHSCCRYNHAALDALLRLRSLHTFSHRDVARVEVDSYRLAAMLNDHQPATTLAIRFSIPYAIAIALVRGSTDPSAFDESSLTDQAIRAVAAKVEVREEPSFTSMTPSQRPARVTVHLVDGRSLSEVVYSSRGDPDQPFAEEELVEKYLRLAAPVIGEENAQRALSLIERPGTLHSVREVTELLQGVPN